MKQDIFNQYIEKVSNLFGITKAEMFSKTKKKDIVDARHLVYYLCLKRPMSIAYIEKYMNMCGYHINHSSIVYGAAMVKKRIEDDSDYITIIKKIENSVFI